MRQTIELMKAINFTFIAIITLLSGCVVNPVTGRSEIGLVSTAQQINIGKQQYLPAQQMQGGRYSVDPQLSAYVSQVGARVAQFSGIELPYEFVVLNNSVPNAWALPGGKLAINRGLLMELKNEAELAAVLAHEVVHAAARHGAKQIERGLLLQGAVLVTAVSAGGSTYGESLLQGAQAAAGMINQKYGRDAERESDYYGTRYLAQAGYDPYAAVSLQETFVRLSEDKASGWLEGLFSSHPPSAERVSNNRSLVATLRSEGFTGGVYGADEYLAATRTLRNDAPAYQAFDDARSAMFAGNYDAAAELIGEALSLQYAEPIFHGLRGDIRFKQKRFADAVTNYDRAVARDADFFSHYLGRGMAHAALGKSASAKSDLNRSLQLLPTTIAYLELGKLAEAQGDQAAAVRYYEAAGQGQDSVANEARSGLVQIDLPRRPERYLSSRVGVDADGRWQLEVVNATAFAVTDIQVRIQISKTGERTSSFIRSIASLGAGARRKVALTAVGSDALDVRSVVVSARL